MIVNHAADVGTRAEDFEMDWIFAGCITLPFELAPVEVEHEEIFRCRSEAERVARQDEAIRVRQPCAQVAETFYEASSIKEAPSL
jgi:hypothetical protein